MDRKALIHNHLKMIANELLAYIQENEAKYPEKWMPASDIKKALDLNFVAVPKQNAQYGEKGWLFAILARMLEDNNQVEFKKEGSRSFYRALNNPFWQTIIEVGCEGGVITLLGKKEGHNWFFKMATDETSLLCFVNKEELPGSLSTETGVVSSWEEALNLLNQYGWVTMYPVEAHPDFSDKIMSAVIEALKSPELDHYHENFDWGRWKQVLSGDKEYGC